MSPGFMDISFSANNSTWLVISFFVAVLAASTMGIFGGNKFPVEGKTVLLTGASEGMGLACAKILASKGAHLIIVSRSVSKLENALEEVTASAKDPSAQRFRFISADISVPNYATALLAEAKEWNGGRPLDVVWNVAGMATPELFVDMEMSSMRQQMDVNFFGTAEMSHAILREWLAPTAPVTSDTKHLIMTTSVAAFYSVAGYGPYSPSKWAIRSLADTISQELRMYPQNVKCHVVFPGTIISPGWHREEQTKPLITKQLEEADPEQTPEQCAAAAIKGLEAGHYNVTVTWLGELMRWGALGGSYRNNWLIDAFGTLLCVIVWPFVLMDMYMKTSSHLKKHGHPSSLKKSA